MTALRSALLVAVPEAAAAVDDWRERTCPDRPSIGVPPHVTILFPFAPADQLDADVTVELENLVAEVEPFDFVLREPRRFPGVLYLAPEPAEPFLALVHRVAAAYPRYPPYRGEVPLESVVPHLTVAQGDAATLDRVEADVHGALPISATAKALVLLEEVEPDWGRWRPRAAFAFGG
jgi:2'-5' RNA ligase